MFRWFTLDKLWSEVYSYISQLSAFYRDTIDRAVVQQLK